MKWKDKDVRPAKYAQGLALGKSKTQAGLDAGYSLSRSRKAVERIENQPNVRRAMLRYYNRAEASAERTIEQIRRVAYMDPRGFFDEHGNLIPIHKLTEEQAAGIKSFEVIKKNAVAGDGQIDTIHKMQFHNSMDANKLLAQHFHLIDEVVKVDQDITIKVSWAKDDPENNIIDVTPEVKQISESAPTHESQD